MRHKAAISSLALLEFFGIGCSQYRGPGPHEPVTLVFKHAKRPRYTALSQLIRQFEAENPAIRVREEILPSSTDEHHQFYVINLAAHAGDFDVLDMDIIWVPEFARAGWLSPLNPSVTAAELSRLNQAALRADWLSGQLYAVPWFVDAGVLYYRKDLLAKGFCPGLYPALSPRAFGNFACAAVSNHGRGAHLRPDFRAHRRRAR